MSTCARAIGDGRSSLPFGVMAESLATSAPSVRKTPYTSSVASPASRGSSSEARPSSASSAAAANASVPHTRASTRAATILAPLINELPQLPLDHVPPSLHVILERHPHQCKEHEQAHEARNLSHPEWQRSP